MNPVSSLHSDSMILDFIPTTLLCVSPHSVLLCGCAACTYTCITTRSGTPLTGLWLPPTCHHLLGGPGLQVKELNLKEGKWLLLLIFQPPFKENLSHLDKGSAEPGCKLPGLLSPRPVCLLKPSQAPMIPSAPLCVRTETFGKRKFNADINVWFYI